MAKIFLLALLGVVLASSLSQAKVLQVPTLENALSSSSSEYVADKSSNVILDTLLETIGDTMDDLNDDEVDDIVEEFVDAVAEAGTTGAVDDDEMTGFPVEDLDEEELNELILVEDSVLMGQLDVHIAKQLFRESRALAVPSPTGHHGRRKRIAPLIGRAAFTIGRALFRQFARGGATRSGSRVTQHYRGAGNYQSAVRDFQRMRPSDVTSFSGKISGQTGRVGNYRVTVRDGSSKGVSRPTLSVQREGAKDFVRKFRYEQ